MNRNPREFAENKGQYDAMLQAYGVADTEEEIQSISMLYAMDLSYVRSDVLLARREGTRLMFTRQRETADNLEKGFR